MLLRKKQNVVLQVVYFIPDYPSLMQDFTWAYQDVVPELMRTHQFLNHWHNNIDAVINQLLISIDQSGWREYRHAIDYTQYN